MDKHIKVMGRSDLYIATQSHQSDRLKVPDMITQPLWKEAARMIMESTRYKSFGSFREHMVDSHSYNSSSMRKKYSRYITKWFFPDEKLGTLSQKVWMSYHDEKILQEIMRYQYLRAESGVAEFVVNVITPLDPGAAITSEHIQSFVLKTFDGVSYEYVPKITEIIRSALKCLGFIANRKGRFVVQEIEPPKTALMILTHYIFAPEPQTVAVRDMLKDPFWKYLGIKRESTVRETFKEASSKGLISRYTVADELEQITTRYSLEELLKSEVKL